MLIEQAALAFEKWTGAKADRMPCCRQCLDESYLLNLLDDGWLGAKENLIPGLVIIFFAAITCGGILCIFFSSAMHWRDCNPSVIPGDLVSQC
jgi:hypothetical protein